MERRAKSWHRLLLWIAAVVVLLVLAGAAAMAILEWKPAEVEPTALEGRAARVTVPSRLRILSWNIGYASLDREADFFMDGGRGVRAPSKERVERNLESISKTLAGAGADIVLLQEVDIASARSHFVNELAFLAGVLDTYTYAYAPNFRTWVPVPFLDPLGKVESGLVTLSAFDVERAERLQLPGLPPWPVRVFHLKRCLHRLKLRGPNGRPLVVINLHLSVFDKGGRQRKVQLEYLRNLLEKTAATGAYVIAGGDWNHAPPGVGPTSFPHGGRVPEWFRQMPGDWLPEGFSLAFDTGRPSLRSTDMPYSPGSNFITVVDGFVVGPGVRVLSVRTMEKGFYNSDHEPVLLEVELLPNGGSE